VEQDSGQVARVETSKIQARTGFWRSTGEPKGAVVIGLAAGGVGGIEFRPLRTRPMAICRVALAGLGAAAARAELERALCATPADAVAQLRIEGPVPDEVERLLAAASLRAMGGARNVSIQRTRQAEGMPARSSPLSTCRGR
jgi:hypothetical protein